MYPRLALALLFGFSAIGFGLAVPASPLDAQCGDANAEYRECGPACPPTCRRPKPPHCSLRCMRGCFCKDGYLRNDEGKCTLVAQCDAQTSIDVSASFAPTCPEKEEFLGCGSACAPTCAQPVPPAMCTKNCVVGCFCLGGHLRNEHGVCVPSEQCAASQPIIPIPPRVCQDNEEFRQCRGCDGTCDQPNPLCPRICIPGCACKEGHLRDDANGKCIPRQTCVSSMMTDRASSAIKQCGQFEVFNQCGSACPPTCHWPHPPRCSLRCIPGCYCQAGYLKNSEGKCVSADQCDQVQQKTTPTVETKCSSDREMLVTECGSQMDCMATCGMPLPWMIHGHVQIPKVCKERQCEPSCVCKYPYVRNEIGQCVERAQCDHKTTTSH